MKLCYYVCILLWTVEASELPLVCIPSKPVAAAGDSVELTAWAPPGTWQYDWSAGIGNVSGRGSSVIWDLSGAPSGEHFIRLSATRAAVATLHCQARVFVERKTDSRGDVFSRKFLLGPGQSEMKGYGLYSYVVLTPAGTDKVAMARNRKVLEEWKAKILSLSALERKEPVGKLNAIFVPVTQNTADPDLDWLEKHYDYRRADHLLQRIPGNYTNGPYLISSPRPLSSRKANERLLILDASWATPSTVAFWFSAFTNQAAQERFDVPGNLVLFNLKLRTIISVLAEGIPHAKEALASIVLVGK